MLLRSYLPIALFSGQSLLAASAIACGGSTATSIADASIEDAAPDAAECVYRLPDGAVATCAVDAGLCPYANGCNACRCAIGAEGPYFEYCTTHPCN